MKIVSTNIGEKKEVFWRKKFVKTGIYKYPTNESIFLGKTDVEKDSVIDRKYHGGVDKACYMYSEKHYEFWKKQYPLLEWNYGMFGENLTVQNFDESEVYIGNIYKIGEALVQISEPRQPCFKLGIRFENQNILKKFIASGYCGAYLRVIEEGNVKTNDELILVEEDELKLSVKTIFKMLYSKLDFSDLEIKNAFAHAFLAESTKKHFR